MGNELHNPNSQASHNNIENNHEVCFDTVSEMGQLAAAVRKHLSEESISDGYEGPYDEQLRGIENGEIQLRKGPEFYQGFLNEQGKANEFGKVIKSDGSVVLGIFEDGKVGEGRYIFGDGSYYQGEFANGMASGKGRLVKENFVYEGEFQKNCFEGTGEINVGNKYHFKGKFRGGKKVEGTLMWYENETKKCEYIGSFGADE